MNTLFSIAVLIISIVVHEVSHGLAALSQGDPTAKYAGRLTINPIKHVDIFGSIILPLVMALIPGGIILGWAKPVPVNPYNFKNGRWSEFVVSFAGPGSNILIALIAGLVFRFAGLPVVTAQILLLVVTVNLVLAVFNLIPVTPLDGSKILFSILPAKLGYIKDWMERYSLILPLIVVFFLWRYFLPIVAILFSVITGVN